MRTHRLAALALSFLAPLAASAVLGQKPEAGLKKGVEKLDPELTCVRVLLGVGDTSAQDWSGTASVDRGEVVSVEGYRFRKGDDFTGAAGWIAKSHLIRKVAAKKQALTKKELGGPSTYGASFTPNGVIICLKAPDEAVLSLKTGKGTVAIALGDLASGSPRSYLDGKVVAQRVSPSVELIGGAGQQDFPAAVSDGRGGAWLTYVEHSPRGSELSTAIEERLRDFSAFKPSGGGDQIKLTHYADGKISETLDVTEPGRDVWRPAVALDERGDVVVAWSENRSGNFDIFERRYRVAAREFSKEARVTTNPGSDANVALAASPQGPVWAVWQSWEDGRAYIRIAALNGEKTESRRVSAGPGNEWSPTIAIDGRRTIHVAYDTYETGNYDVELARFGANGEPLGVLPIANTPLFEARPSVAVDPSGRVWIAYEERTENWGKDAENLVTGAGSTLYRQSRVKVKCVDGMRVLDAPDPVAGAAEPLQHMNSYARIACDSRGRVWLAFRHRLEAVWGGQAVMVIGGVWIEQITSLAGKAWAPIQPLSSSDGLLDNRPALVPARGDGPLLVFSSSDGRLRREVEFTPELAWKYYSHSGPPPGVYDNDLFVAAVKAPAGGVDPALTVPEPNVVAPPAVVHSDENGDVARIRAYRLNAGGKTYQIARGDFHRHSEISQDGGSDGALEDMWRYAIDAAAFDWMGDADHDNGGGKEYTWWLVQKTTDLYNSPRLVGMFSYERSNSYPHGHRNVMFAKRGVRTLPRLMANGQVVDTDTLMLYDYLKEHDGICASHTSGTGMGTDWRDMNPVYEPFVEIFQGHRNSYEHLGAPRVARRPTEAIGGWKPLGMVWNALAMQYRFGFQASSDHISTHISYAIALTEDRTREAILDAFKRRHCYGATDNIIMDVRSGEHIMGDEFNAPVDGPVKIKVFAQGTRPIARIDVIKDFRYLFSTEPKQTSVSFEWTDDEKRGPGLSWYYVRAIQDDGQLAWASPMWVHFPATAAGR